ncbi:hypothetical protein HZY83_08100 [Gemella sp. GH3]|uniref:hypothetical protein n=1 Tax=unclassified Gemella TaxID=2624949 RepID=UPI0015D06B85|nr:MULTISPECIES: hypothetical protein [unclassified Gemella]MBF0714631.1 hypothetical protein [Gemella sp. GH3.1]NYS51583.1 hypothetical protein [Gemella sp. GH3]
MSMITTLMYLLHISPPKLSKQQVYNIKNNFYKLEEMLEIRNHVIKTHKNLSTGLNRAILIVIFVFIFISVLSIISGNTITVNNIFFIHGFIFMILCIILFAFKIFFVNTIKRQYNKLIYLYYYNNLDELYID